MRRVTRACSASTSTCARVDQRLLRVDQHPCAARPASMRGVTNACSGSTTVFPALTSACSGSTGVCSAPTSTHSGAGEGSPVGWALISAPRHAHRGVISDQGRRSSTHRELSQEKLPNLVGQEGLEPSANGLRVRCSTIELLALLLRRPGGGRPSEAHLLSHHAPQVNTQLRHFSPTPESPPPLPIPAPTCSRTHAAPTRRPRTPPTTPAAADTAPPEAHAPRAQPPTRPPRVPSRRSTSPVRSEAQYRRCRRVPAGLGAPAHKQRRARHDSNVRPADSKSDALSS